MTPTAKVEAKDPRSRTPTKGEKNRAGQRRRPDHRQGPGVRPVGGRRRHRRLPRRRGLLLPRLPGDDDRPDQPQLELEAGRPRHDAAQVRHRARRPYHQHRGRALERSAGARLLLAAGPGAHAAAASAARRLHGRAADLAPVHRITYRKEHGHDTTHLTDVRLPGLASGRRWPWAVAAGALAAQQQPPTPPATAGPAADQHRNAHHGRARHAAAPRRAGPHRPVARQGDAGGGQADWRGAVGRHGLRARVLHDPARHLQVDSRRPVDRRGAVRSLARARCRRRGDRHGAARRRPASASRCAYTTSAPGSRVTAASTPARPPIPASTPTRWPTRSISRSAACAASPAPSSRSRPIATAIRWRTPSRSAR